MQSRLPATPLETLRLSGVIKMVVKTIHTFAKISGAWKHPAVKAAGDFEEMSLMDKIYWGYKSANPIVKSQKGSILEAYFRKNREENPDGIPLPEGFEVERSLTFAGVGDLIKVDGLENSSEYFYCGTAAYLFSKDILYANLESQLSKKDVSEYVFSEKETPPLCFTDNQYRAITFHNGKQYNIMNTACNHSLDMGLEGLQTTLDRLDQDGILDLGTNREPGQQEQGRVFEKNGIRIGFVSATFGLNGKPVPEGKEYMVNVVRFHGSGPDNDEPDMELIRKQIEYCRDRGCDIIMASLHWGYEYEFFPRPQQVAVAHRLAEEGIDVIIGHHSHVLQPLEFYHPQNDPGRTTVIAYSLGNLTSSYSAPYLVLSGILNFSIAKGTQNGQSKTLVKDVQLIPVVQVEDNRGENPRLYLETLERIIPRWEDDPDTRDYLSKIIKYAGLTISR